MTEPTVPSLLEDEDGAPFPEDVQRAFRARVSEDTEWRVHDHGPDEGRGTACREYHLNGRLVGACKIVAATRSLPVGEDTPSHESWCWRRHSGDCVDGPSDSDTFLPVLQSVGEDTRSLDAALNALWQCGVESGMDTDGDTGPDAMVAGMGIAGFAQAMVDHVHQLRVDYEECLSQPATHE